MVFGDGLSTGSGGALMGLDGAAQDVGTGRGERNSGTFTI